MWGGGTDLWTGRKGRFASIGTWTAMGGTQQGGSQAEGGNDAPRGTAKNGVETKGDESSGPTSCAGTSTLAHLTNDVSGKPSLFPPDLAGPLAAGGQRSHWAAGSR